MRYNNYHKHDDFSNIFTPDVNVNIEDYAKRAVELGHTSVFTTNHGSGGDIFISKSVCDKHNIKCVYGMEGYIVEHSEEKDNSNYHIIVIPRTNVVRKKLNKVNSISNKFGFYYKPRLSPKQLIENFDKGDLFITTACLGGILKDENSYENIFTPLALHFGENLYLEVQPHVDEEQIELNKKIKELSNKLGLGIIVGNDSHYIHPFQKEERNVFLNGKGIVYTSENEFILDYPDGDELLYRMVLQGVLNKDECIEAINNTLIFDTCEEIEINKTIKMPTAFPQLNDEQKIEKLDGILNEKFENLIQNGEIPLDKKDVYKKELDKEFQVVKDCSEIHASDYFLLNDKIVDIAINKYDGVLTKTGRGCFTKNAIIQTKESLKTIDKVIVGDEVIGDDGCWHSVINTMSYDIEEEILEFQYQKQGSSKNKFPNECTLDHKILVNRNGKNVYVEAKNLIIGDLLCSPKINHCEVYDDVIIDLNDYNIYGYEYDDDMIYQRVNVNKEYMYSPRWCERNLNISKSFSKDISVGKYPKTAKALENKKIFLNSTPFKTLENYKSYLNKHSYNIVPIKRFLRMDKLTFAFLGLMYGDGWTNKDSAVGLAINKTTKNEYNRFIFNMMANRLNLEVYVNKSKSKNLEQLYINSKIFNNWIATEYFKSKKGNLKNFNTKLLKTSVDNLRWLYLGLLKSDGSVNQRENKISFDNTSLSLINAYRILDNIVNRVMPNRFDVRLSHVDSRGYPNKESYKVVRGIIDKHSRVAQDDFFWYLPITSINILKKHKTKVYDLTVENSHSYVINNIVVHNSGGAFTLNNVLGLTQIDKFDTNLPIYSERFASSARLLEARAMPDFDFNVADQEPFIKATEEVLGETGCYPMVAYGTMQSSEAFRNLCRSKEFIYDEYNEVAKSLDTYTSHKKWGPIIKESLRYVDTITSASVHPCAFLLSNDDIEAEVGVVKVGEHFCAMITSESADEWKYLKNDYLTVTVVDIIDKVFKKIDKPIYSIKELKSKIDDNIWKLLGDGYTCTLNQVDGHWATMLLKEYKPKSVEELAMFVASIRPSFESLRDEFISRKSYSTGSKELDNLLSQTENRVLFQENVIQYFEWLGVAPSESIGLIKKISKKKIKQEDFDKLRASMMEHWKINTGSEDGFENSWDEMQAQMQYGFNSPHGLSTAYDCLYCAYLKHNYPLEYYSTVLDIYSDDEDKTSRLVGELQRYNISIKNPIFGNGRSEYTSDKDTMTIYKGMRSIKFMNKTVPEELYELSKIFDGNFFELLSDVFSMTTINTRQLEILIKVGFFKEFGNIRELLKAFELFEFFKRGKSKQFKKDKLDGVLKNIVERNSDATELMYTKLDCKKIFNELDEYVFSSKIEPPSISSAIGWQMEYYGYISIATGKPEDTCKLLVTEIRPLIAKKTGKPWAYNLSCMSFGSGKTAGITIRSDMFDKNPIMCYNIIRFEPRDLSKKERNGFVNYYLNRWDILC